MLKIFKPDMRMRFQINQKTFSFINVAMNTKYKEISQFYLVAVLSSWDEFDTDDNNGLGMKTTHPRTEQL